MDALSKIAAETTTDKGWLHNYTPIYHKHFEALRSKVTKVLELGVGGGENPGVGGHSLRMWKHYFPNALIVGVDIFDKCEHAEDRIVTLRGSQSDANFISKVVRKYGPFDIIVDDGSHRSSDVVGSLELLWTALCSEGFYVVEDLQYAFDPEFAGSSDIDDPKLSINVIGRLFRAINSEVFAGEVPGVAPAFRDPPYAIHAYPNIVFLEKRAVQHRHALQGGSALALKGSLATIETLIAASPDTAGLHYTRAVILNQLRDTDAAEKAIATATKLSPENAEYMHFAGNLKIVQQKFPAAVKLQRRAIAASRGNPHFHERLAFALTQMQYHAAAIEEARRAIALAPTRPALHATYVWALTAADRLDEAQKAVSDALAIAPRAPELENLADQVRQALTAKPASHD